MPEEKSVKWKEMFLSDERKEKGFERKWQTLKSGKEDPNKEKKSLKKKIKLREQNKF